MYLKELLVTKYIIHSNSSFVKYLSASEYDIEQYFKISLDIFDRKKPHNTF